MKVYVFDVEANGLNPTHLHVLSIHSLLNKKSKSTVDYDQMRTFFTSADVLIGHNITRWDIPNVERLLGIKITAKIVDTMFLSWYLEPDILRHGLEAWGERFGVPKPPIVDWETLPIEEYINRCEQDVIINTKLWKRQFKELLEIYGTKEEVWRFIDYISYKADCALEQEQVGWKLDVPKTEFNLAWLTGEMNAKTKAITNAMPLAPKKVKKSKPKNMYTKDGSFSALAIKWFDFLKEHNLPEDTEDTVQYVSGYSEPNPKSHSQIKAWLDELGWVPETFKFSKSTGENVPQVSLPDGGGICPSVKKLYIKEPALSNLDDYYVIKHRTEVLAGFLKNVDENGYIMAQIQGLTNTLRFKHKTLVNLPKYTGRHTEDNVDYRDGVHIRGCLIAPEGYELCGSDMSSLEDRTKQHYMWEHDPEYVSEMLAPDFDPHIDIAVVGGLIKKSEGDFFKWFKKKDRKEVPDIEEYVEYDKDQQKKLYNYVSAIRSPAKTTNYAATYGAGAAAISRAAGIALPEGKKLHKIYWERNWSIKTIASLVKTKTVGEKMWLYNPVSKFWYSLRNDKDKFSTLNQGTGVFCFDCWVKMVRTAGLKLCGQFHDEVCLVNKPEDRERVTKTLKDSVQKVNKALQLNRALDVEVQFGINYSETH